MTQTTKFDAHSGEADGVVGASRPTVQATRRLIEALGAIGPSRARSIWVGLALCIWIGLAHPTDTTDMRISDRLLVGQRVAADRDYVLIELTPEDLRQYGRPLLSRENMTLLIDAVEEQDPERVLHDFHLGDVIEDTQQRKRAEALERFAPRQLGLVTSLNAGDAPHPRYAAAGTMLDGRLTTDPDGWHRRIGRDDAERGFNPAIWLGTGELTTDTMPIDLRIAHDGYELVSAADVLEGKVALTGRKVIMSAGPEVAPSRAYVPHSKAASRAKVFAMAAQSAESGYLDRSRLGASVALALTVLAMALGFFSGRTARSGRRLAVLAIASVLVLIVSHITVAVEIGVPVTLSAALTCYFIMLNATLVHRFQIVPLLQNFLRGDLSPEEAWAWRAYEQTVQPAVLLGGDGRVKRSNPAAALLCDHFGNLLARECQPAPGERATEITLRDSGNVTRIFELDWPFAKLALVTLRDVTEFRAEQETLRGQLYRDELTGCTNRRGFDRELADIVRRGASYELFFIDLNGFKQVNDTHGHDAGDELLVACAQRLGHITRKSDMVARLGGDEFAILMLDSGADFDPDQEKERLAGSLTRPIKLTSSNTIVTIGAAIGHARPCDASETATEVLRRADQAMYSDKAAGKRHAARRAA